MIRKFFAYLKAKLNNTDVPRFSKKVVVLLCYSLLLVPLHVRAETCTSIDYNITTIASGAANTVGIKEDGAVVAVGNDWYGQLNVTRWTNIKAIAAGEFYIVGLKEDGTVVGVGNNFFGQLNVSGWTNIKAIAAPVYHTVGLKEDGTVVAVGYNDDGQLNVSGWTNIKAIAAGSYHTVGLKEDGTVVAAGGGRYNYGQLNVLGWTNIKAIAAGHLHTVGLKEDGTVVAIGDNDYGQLNVSGWTNIKAIAAGASHTVGLREDGTVVAVGLNFFGQSNVSDWTNIKAIAAGRVSTVGLKEGGTVMAVGWNSFGQLNVSDWINIRQPACLNSIQPPTSLPATDTPCDNGGSISLSWTLSPDDGSTVTGYRVYRSTTSGGPYDLIGGVNAGVNNYTDATATMGVTYYYVVRATDVTNESANSNEASVASLRNLPLPPANVTAPDTPYDLGGSITLGWTKSVDDGAGLSNVASYNIYRYSSANGNISFLASMLAGTTGYTDNTTIDFDTYYYFIKALDNQCNMESSASNIATGQSVNNFTALPGYIETLPGVSPELVNSLTSKVENAIKALDRGNETAAINTLNALLKEIEAQSGNKIDASTAETLKTYIQKLILYIQSN